MMTKYHEHPLILEDACRETAISDDSEVCDVCIQPINMSVSPIYKCHDCHFLAHPICANHLPARFELITGSGRDEFLLHGNQMDFFNSIFPCGLCNRPSNGFSYELTKGERIFLDVECIVAPKTIKHASHKQHLLFFTGPRWISEANCKLSCCSGDFSLSVIYRCVICEYSIHIRCALLPKTTRHKFDEHPLELIMSTTDDDDKQRALVFCEVCEQDMELKWWYYGCHKCEQYFHINCIPSVGYLSKVKFGKTHVDYQLHHHPLTLTRMLTHQSMRGAQFARASLKAFQMTKWLSTVLPVIFGFTFLVQLPEPDWRIV